MTRLVRALLPVGVFAVVLLAHAAWRVGHAECTGTEACAGADCAQPASWTTYRDDGSYWLGLSYASSAAFAAVVLRRAVERRTRAAGAGAARGLAVSALLPFAGCWLVGCCGSPMLAVWFNLLGARFMPLAKPLIAGLTGVMLTASWLWMRRAETRRAAACAPGADCGC